MILHDTQKTVALSKKRFRVLNCGRRWGKTTLAIEEIKGKIAAGKTRIAYIAPTYQQSRDIAWEQLKKEIKGVEFNESRLEIKIGDTLIQLKGWESIETLRGQAFDFLVVDEVAMMRNFWTNWQEVIRPTLTDRKGKALFISTPKGFNHFYDLYNIQGKDEDFESFHFTSYENPFVPTEEIDKAKQEITEDRFAQEYLADFRKTEGLVYKEFDRSRHLTTDEPRNVVKVMAGIDWGFTNPAAVYRIREDGDRHYWIDSEYYKTQKTKEEVIEYVKTLRPEIVYPDPEDSEAIEKVRRAGLNVRDVSKDIVNGIDAVKELFKQNRLHINSSCVNLIWELESYRYPDKKPDQNEKEKPIKENDHACDCIRYVLYNQAPKILSYKTQWNLKADPNLGI